MNSLAGSPIHQESLKQTSSRSVERRQKIPRTAGFASLRALSARPKEANEEEIVNNDTKIKQSP